jgi:excisionase family DNA binding protein
MTDKAHRNSVSPGVAARILGCHVDTVYRWISSRHIVETWRTPTGRIRVSREEVYRLASRYVTDK